MKSISLNRRSGLTNKMLLTAGVAVTLSVVSTPALAINEARSFLGWGRWNNNNVRGSNVVIANIEPGHPLPNHVSYSGKIDMQLSWPFDQSGLLSGIIMQPATPFGEPVPGRNWHSTHATSVASALVGSAPSSGVVGIAPEARLITGAIGTHIDPESGAFQNVSPTSVAFALFALTDQEVADSVAEALGMPPYQVATVVNSSYGFGGLISRAGEHYSARIYNTVAYMTGATLVTAVGDEGSLHDDLMPPEGSLRSPGSAYNTIGVGSTNATFQSVTVSSSGGESPTANWVVSQIVDLLPEDLDMLQPLPNVTDDTIFEDRIGVDMVAPGTLLRLAGSQSNPVNNPGPTSFSDFWSGTSYASAIVAGAAALVHDVGIRDNLWHEGRPSSLVTKAVLMNSATKLQFNNSTMFEEDRWPNTGGAFVTMDALDDREGAGQLNLRRLWNQFALADIKDFVEPDDPRFDGKNTLEGYTIAEDGTITVPVFGTNPDVPFSSFQRAARPVFDDDPDFGPIFRSSQRRSMIPYRHGASWIPSDDESVGTVAQGGLGTGGTDLDDDSFDGPLVPPNFVPDFRPPRPEPPEPPDTPFDPMFRTGWDHGRISHGVIELPLGVVTAGSTITATLCWHRQERWDLPDFAAPLALIDPSIVVPTQFLGAQARNARSLPPNPAAPERVRNAKPLFEYLDRRITTDHGDCGCGFNLEAFATRAGGQMDRELLDHLYETVFERMEGQQFRLGNAYNHRGTGLDIQYVLSPGVASNPAMVAALDLAAQIWESVIEDPTTIQVLVEVHPLGDFVVAQAGTFSNGFEYEDVRQALVAKAGAMELNAINALPTDVISFVTSGFTNTIPPQPLMMDSDDFGGIVVHRPLARALGFNVSGGIDSFITFNSQFQFDFDPSNGISPGLQDFVYVMVHELGHMLGFISHVDRTGLPINEPPPMGSPPTVLDLFRFGIDDADNNPASPADFTMFPREFRPGVESALSTVDLINDIDTTFRFSTGNFNGDGRQSAHWKDDVLLGLTEVIGVMDPTTGPPGSYSEGYPKTSDMLAMSLIGWDIDFLQDPPQPGPGVGEPETNQVLRIVYSNPGELGVFPEAFIPDGLGVEFAHQNLELDLWIREFDGITHDLYMVSEGMEITEGGTDGGERWRPVQHIFAPGVPFGDYVLRIRWHRTAFDFGGFFLDGFQNRDPGNFPQLGAVQSIPRPRFRFPPDGEPVELYTRLPDGDLEYGVAWYIDLVDTGGEFLTDNQPPLPGDLNGDGVVDASDLAILLGKFGSSDPRYDLTGDGKVGSADLGVLLGRFGSTR